MSEVKKTVDEEPAKATPTEKAVEEQAATPAPPTDEEVDLDSLLEDPEKLAALNERIAARKAPKPVTTEKPESAEGPPKPAEEEPPSPPEDKVLRTVKFYNKPREVRESEVDALLQKGLQFDRVWPELAPIRELTLRNPAFARILARAQTDPAFLARLVEVERPKEPATREIDFAALKKKNPALAEYRDEDLAAAAALYGEINKAMQPADAGSGVDEAEVAALRESEAILGGLRAMDPVAYRENALLAQEVFAAMEAQEGPVALQNYKQMISNPRNRDESGTPLLTVFYRELDRVRTERLKPPPAAAAEPSKSPPPPPPKRAPTGRIPSGAPASGPRKFGEGSAWDYKSNEDFDKAAEEFLAQHR